MAFNKKISDLLSGVVLILSLFASTALFPFLGLVIGILTPLPIAFYFRKMGRGYGTLMLAVAGILVISIAGIRAGALFLLEFAAMGVALSETVRMKLPLGRGVLLPAITSLTGSVILLMTVLSPVGKGLPDIIGEHIHQNVKDTVDAYKKTGLPDEQAEGLTEFARKLETFILRTFPSLSFIGLAYLATLNLLILKGLLRRRHLEEYKVDMTSWRSPEPLVWLLIAGGTLLIIKDEWAMTVGLNLLVVCGGVYLLQGIAIVAFYFEKMKTPLSLRIIGYLLMLFQQIFTILVVGFGLFDLWFDFRRLEKEVS